MEGISDPNNSSVSMQTYKFQDQSYIWRGSLIQIIVVCPYKHTNLMTSTTYGGVYFLAGLLDQFPVNISVSTEKMLAGGWSGGLAGK